MNTGGTYTVRDVKMRDEYPLVPFGDIHWGPKACHEKAVDKHIARVAEDPNARWCGLGDFWDLITWQDGRFNPEGIADAHKGAFFKRIGKTMLRYAAKKLEPIKDKGLFLLQGNHEFRYGIENDQNLMMDLAEMLDIPYLGYATFFRILYEGRHKTVELRICAHHGAGYAATKGGKLNRLERFMTDFQADVYLLGHLHEALDSTKTQLKANEDCTMIEEENRTGVMCGSFYRSYVQGDSTYAERKLYHPTTVGCPVLYYTPGDQTLKVEKPGGKVGRVISG